jgi:hypothetical protein
MNNIIIRRHETIKKDVFINDDDDDITKLIKITNNITTSTYINTNLQLQYK